MPELFDPLAAWRRLHPKLQEQIGAAAVALGVADVCLGASPCAFNFDAASAEAARVLQALAEGSVLQRGQLPEGVDLAPLGIRQCKQCGCTDDFACDGGCEWVAEGLCSRCQHGERVA